MLGQAPLGITPSHHAQSSTKMALAVTQHVWARTTTTVTGQDAEDHTLEGLAQNIDKYFNPLTERAQTPVQINCLQIELSQHPDPVFVNSLINDMTFVLTLGTMDQGENVSVITYALPLKTQYQQAKAY